MHRYDRIALVRLALAACLSTLVVPATVAAQPARRDSVVASRSNPDIATLILVDSLDHPSARAVVIRRPGELPNNIILVTRATTAPDLVKAVTALMGSRRGRGNHIDREMRAIIGPATQRALDETRNDRRAAEDLRRLGRAPAFAINGVATGPAIVIRMSPVVTKGSAGGT